MLALYATDPQHLPRLRAALHPEQQLLEAHHWNQVEDGSLSVTGLIVLIEWLHTSPVFPRLAALKARHPQRPVVLVTRWDPENARHLKDIVVEEVVWFREMDQKLAPAVRRLCSNDASYVRDLAGVFERARHLPPTLREAFTHACRSERPVHSVNQLAAAVGCDRRTLWNQWTKAVDTSSLRLQDFLHWILLLRATGRKTPDRSWSGVADELGVHAHTLSRFSKQLAGCTLPELATGGEAVTALFREQVLGMVLP